MTRPSELEPSSGRDHLVLPEPVPPRSAAQPHLPPVKPHAAVLIELDDRIVQLIGKGLSRLVAGRSPQHRRMPGLAVVGQTNIGALMDVAAQYKETLVPRNPRVHRL